MLFATVKAIWMCTEKAKRHKKCMIEDFMYSTDEIQVILGGISRLRKSFNNETARKQSLGCESYIRNFAESYLDLAKTDRDAKILSEDESAKSGAKAAYSSKLKKLTRRRDALREKN